MLYDHNIVAVCDYVPGSLNMNAEDAPTFSSSGFLMTTGDDNICRNNVVVGGALGDAADGGAYNWEATLNEGVWKFNNNLAHNNACGLRTWQNSTKGHLIEDFITYHNGLGIFHGAYANNYRYTGGIVYGNSIEIKAASVDTNRVRMENLTLDGAGLVDYCIRVIDSPLDGLVPVFLRNLDIKGFKKAAISDEATQFLKSIDVVACTIAGTPFYFTPDASSNEVIRMQPVTGQAQRLTTAGTSNIAAFAPTVWGSGDGLKGEYFNSVDFTKPAFTRIDPNVSFNEWSSGVHHLITSNTYSVRWTGKIMAQFTESITFWLGSGGGMRLWVNGQLILDSWTDNYPDVYPATPISLTAGQQYDIKLEYFNTDDKTGMGLQWESKSMPRQYVPMSQLYSGTAVTPPPPAANQNPVANAGADQTITLPVNRVTLDGSASYDPDGTLSAYKWSYVSGPATGTMTNATAAIATAAGLVEGSYVYRLTVTDSNGATATDDVTVIVNPAPTTGGTKSGALTVTASPNPTSTRWMFVISSDSTAPITLSIYNSNGNQVVSRTGISAGSTVYAGGHLKAGTYFARIVQGYQTFNITLIKT
ncbi:MAG: T9SS type A sorting domain-containing protein [Bacteroidetes bacterium]|nr:T9SS type A sorting domain-containing protein [Bacteroidota bacterium]